SGNSPCATPSGRPVDVPGMFQINQCVMSIFEPLFSTGSGSCNSSTKLCVPGGTCDHWSAGETALGPAACVGLFGTTLPSCQAELVIKSGGVAGPRPPAGACCAAIEPPNTATSETIVRFLIVRLTSRFLICVSVVSLRCVPQKRRQHSLTASLPLDRLI